MKPRRRNPMAERVLKELVSSLPLETPVRRRARDPTMASRSFHDDPAVERYLHAVHKGAQALDRHSLLKSSGLINKYNQPVEKELVFLEPSFGLTFSRDADVFGFNPLIVVKAIARDSPAAGLLGVGDTLLAVDGHRMTNVPHREVMRAIADASLNASPDCPRSLTFLPVHTGPAEVAAPLRVDDDETGYEVDDERSDVEGDSNPSARLGLGSRRRHRVSEESGTTVGDDLGGREEDEELVYDVMDEEELVDDSITLGRPTVMQSCVRLEAMPGLKRLPHMWHHSQRTPYGVLLELEFTTAPLGILFQGRTVKGTTASSPASVLLQPGDRLMTVNDVNLEMWGRLRVQDALNKMVADMSPECPKRLQFFRSKKSSAGALPSTGIGKATTKTATATAAAPDAASAAPPPTQQRKAVKDKKDKKDKTASFDGSSSKKGSRSAIVPGSQKGKAERSRRKTIGDSEHKTAARRRSDTAKKDVPAEKDAAAATEDDTDDAAAEDVVDEKEDDGPQFVRSAFGAAGAAKSNYSGGGDDGDNAGELEEKDNANVPPIPAGRRSVKLSRNEDNAPVVIRRRGGSTAAAPSPTAAAAPATPAGSPPSGSATATATATATAGAGADSIVSPRGPFSRTAAAKKKVGDRTTPPPAAAAAGAGAGGGAAKGHSVQDFSGRLVPEELEKLSAIAVAAAKAGAKAGAEVGAVAGASAGAKAGSLASKSVDKTAAASVGAEAGAKAGAKVGAVEGAKAGAKAGEEVGRKMGGEEGAKEGRVAGSKSGAMAGAKAGSWAGAKLGASAAASSATP